jgi:DNA-binding XRE family transcriptional regulator
MDVIHPLKAYRETHDLTQHAAAKKVGVRRETWARWEGGRRIDADYLASISRKTGIPKAALRPDLAELMEPTA